MSTIIDSTSLREQLAAGPVQFLDVRLADDFAAAHLPGAVNNCVFEVAFAERLAGTAPDKTSPVIVSGASIDGVIPSPAFQIPIGQGIVTAVTVDLVRAIKAVDHVGVITSSERLAVERRSGV